MLARRRRASPECAAVDENRLLSRKELAAALGVSTRTVDRWIREQTGPTRDCAAGRPATVALGRPPDLAYRAPRGRVGSGPRRATVGPHKGAIQRETTSGYASP